LAKRKKIKSAGTLSYIGKTHGRKLQMRFRKRIRFKKETLTDILMFIILAATILLLSLLI
jgi:hypothetical protein